MKIKMARSLLTVVLVLLMLSPSASASDSLFNLLPSEPTPKPASQSSVAPSYGDFAGVVVDDETVNNKGDTVVTYQNVSARQMEDFGAALKKESYSVVEQGEQGNTVAYKLSNDVFTFTLFYDKANQNLQVVYPKGTVFAQSVFPGYTKVKLGETFKIKGLGEFTFHSFTPCENIKDYGHSYKGKLNTTKMVSSFSGYLIEFTYYNVSKEAKDFWTVGDERNHVYSEIFKSTLSYDNDDDLYQFEPEHAGYFNGEYLRCDPGAGYNCIPSLESAERAISFNPPTGVKNATDGTLGMTMDFPNGEKYVLMLRENGVNLY